MNAFQPSVPAPGAVRCEWAGCTNTFATQKDVYVSVLLSNVFDTANCCNRTTSALTMLAPNAEGVQSVWIAEWGPVITSVAHVPT